MIDWSFPPELQEKYERIVAHQRKLQAELGIEPRTLEERARDYEKKKAEEQRRQEELAKYTNLVGQKRSPPKWKL